jgi:hypothetical protein
MSNVAVGKAGLTSPGKDEMCHGMLAHLSDEALDKVLGLYNRVWEEGKLPGSWNPEAREVPNEANKLSANPKRPTSYRPTSLPLGWTKWNNIYVLEHSQIL